MKTVRSAVRPAIVSLLVFTALLGIAYPLVVGGLGALLFPDRAASAMIAQPFDEPGYFWSRPSALAPGVAMTSSGTNAGPSGFIDEQGTLGPNPAVVAAVKARIQALRDADPGNPAKVPVDLVTASGSGLDPHISPAAAYYQLGRVARARDVTAAQLKPIVDRHVEGRTFGLLGEPRVNVLQLNLAIDATFGKPR